MAGMYDPLTENEQIIGNNPYYTMVQPRGYKYFFPQRIHLQFSIRLQNAGFCHHLLSALELQTYEMQRQVLYSLNPLNHTVWQGERVIVIKPQFRTGENGRHTAVTRHCDSRSLQARAARVPFLEVENVLPQVPRQGSLIIQPLVPLFSMTFSSILWVFFFSLSILDTPGNSTGECGC